MNHNTELSSWMKDLILNFRKEYKKLSNEDKNRPLFFENLNKPCQADIIRISDEELNTNFQLHFFTKFEDKDDLNIKVIVLDSQNYIDSLDKYFENKENELLSDDSSIIDKNRYLAGLEINIYNGIDYFNNHVPSLHSGEKNISPEIIPRTGSDNSFCWVSIGKIEEMETKRVVKKFITDIKRRKIQEIENTPKVNVKKRFVDGFGTFFYPSIWIGEIKTSFKDMIHETPVREFRGKIHDTTYKNKTLIVYNDGFIAIEGYDKTKATKMFNEIMATALLNGIPAFKVNEGELGEVQIDTKNQTIGSQSMYLPNSMRNHLVNPKWSIEEKFNRIKVSKNKVLEVFPLAEKLIVDEVFKDFSIFYLESFTFFHSYSYSQSFLMSWLIIERYLSLLWENNVTNKFSRNRKKKLEDPVRWSADYIIEILNLLNIINSENYIELIRLKKKRNKIVHEGIECSKTEAGECLNFAKLVLTQGLTPEEEKI